MVTFCFAIAIFASILLTAKAEKQYAATSSLLLSPSSDFEPQRTVETNLQLLSLPVLANRTAKKLPGDISGEEVEDSLELTQQGESDIVRIKATTSDSKVAAEMANTYADEFLAFKEVGDGEDDVSPEAGEGGEGEDASTVRIVERATPEDSPVSPQPAKNLIFGGLIGLVLGLGLALLLEQLDGRVKREDDLPEVMDLPILATIPKRKSLSTAGIGEGSLSPAEADIFLRLRANLRYFNSPKDVRSLLITSAGPGEGKSMVSLGLALAAAMTGERALLIEADLRDPSVAEALRIPRNRGLSWVLADEEHHFSGAVASVAGTQIAQSAGGAAFDVLTSGPIPPNPTELVASRRMRELILEAEQVYDFVIVDSPPILVVPDTLPLVSAVGGVLAVSGLGVSTRGAVSALIGQLEMMEAPTLGMVINFASESGRSLEAYGYGRPPEVGLHKAKNATRRPARPASGGGVDRRGKPE